MVSLHASGLPADAVMFSGIYFRLQLEFHKLLWPENLFPISKTNSNLNVHNCFYFASFPVIACMHVKLDI